MNFLGSVGSMYMIILIFLLVISFGFVGIVILRFMTEPKASKMDKRQNNANEKNGGLKFMNSWLRLALFSFVAILVSMAVLSFISPGALMGANVMNSNMYYGNMPMNTPYGNVQMQSGMPMGTPNGNMQMQGGMPMNQSPGGMGMMSMPMGNTQMQSAPMNQGAGGMPINNMPANNMQVDNNAMMQMLNQMQMQLNQMQQQIQQLNMGGGSGAAMPPSGGAAMPAGGGMGMM